MVHKLYTCIHACVMHEPIAYAIIEVYGISFLYTSFSHFEGYFFLALNRYLIEYLSANTGDWLSFIYPFVWRVRVFI